MCLKRPALHAGLRGNRLKWGVGLHGHCGYWLNRPISGRSRQLPTHVRRESRNLESRLPMRKHQKSWPKIKMQYPRACRQQCTSEGSALPSGEQLGVRGLRLVQAWGAAVGCSTLHMGTSAVLPVGPSVWNCVGAGKPAAVTFFWLQATHAFSPM